jgi:hypothetical protein
MLVDDCAKSLVSGFFITTGLAQPFNKTLTAAIRMTVRIGLFLLLHVLIDDLPNHFGDRDAVPRRFLAQELQLGFGQSDSALWFVRHSRVIHTSDA